MHSLAHLTLNTGHLRDSPRTEVDDVVIGHLDPLIRAKRGAVPGSDGIELAFSIAGGKERCLVQIVTRENGGDYSEPFILFSLAWSEDAAAKAWTAMLGIAKSVGVPVAAEAPQTTPQLVALLTPAAVRVRPDILAAAADLERCIAWTILAREGLSA